MLIFLKSLYNWITGSKIAQIGLEIGIAIAALSTALLRAFYRGKKDQRADDTKATLEAVENADAIREKINSLPADSPELDRLRDKWK